MTCSAFFDMHEGFWSSSWRKTCMWNATDSHFLRLPYQLPSSSTDCTRELFNSSNGSASLVDCTRIKIFWLGMRIFCDWCHKWSNFRVILAHVTWPRAQPLGQSFSLKFSLETRLESESFEPLTDFLAFLVQNLWFKINKLNNHLISQIFY